MDRFIVWQQSRGYVPATITRRLDLNGLAPTLIVTGDGAAAMDGHRSYPAAFGAVLSWDYEGYARMFLRVQFGHRDAQVSVSISPDGRIVFILRNIGNRARELRIVSQQTIVLNSCHPAPRLAVVWGLDRRWQIGMEFECF